jgi:hypothetical protein
MFLSQLWVLMHPFGTNFEMILQMVKVAAENAMDSEDKAQKETLSSRRMLLKTIFDAANLDVTVPPAMRKFDVHGDAETA